MNVLIPRDTKAWLVFLVLGFLFYANPSESKANTFTPDDVARWQAVDQQINALTHDIEISTKSTPSQNVETITEYYVLYRTVQAIQERYNGISMIIAISVYMRCPPDEAAILRALEGELLPKTSEYIGSLRRAVDNISHTAFPGGLYQEYVTRTLKIIDDGIIPNVEKAKEAIGSAHQ